MKHVKFRYLYRDAGNYKNHGQIVFAGDNSLNPDMATSALRHSFMQDGLFIAHQVRLPELLPYLDGELTSDDHCFHEFDLVELTDDAPNDHFGRSINEFLTEVQRESLAGWQAFDPYERLNSPEYDGWRSQCSLR